MSFDIPSFDNAAEAAKEAIAETGEKLGMEETAAEFSNAIGLASNEELIRNTYMGNPESAEDAAELFAEGEGIMFNDELFRTYLTNTPVKQMSERAVLALNKLALDNLVGSKKEDSTFRSPDEFNRLSVEGSESHQTALKVFQRLNQHPAARQANQEEYNARPISPVILAGMSPSSQLHYYRKNKEQFAAAMPNSPAVKGDHLSQLVDAYAGEMPIDFLDERSLVNREAQFNLLRNPNLSSEQLDALAQKIMGQEYDPASFESSADAVTAYGNMDKALRLIAQHKNVYRDTLQDMKRDVYDWVTPTTRKVIDQRLKPKEPELAT